MLGDAELKALTSVGGMGALAAAVRCIIDNNRTLSFFLTTFVLCIFASILAGYIVQDMAISEGFKSAIIGSASLLARELITALIKIGEVIRDNSARMAQFFINKRFDQNEVKPTPPIDAKK